MLAELYPAIIRLNTRDQELLLRALRNETVRLSQQIYDDSVPKVGNTDSLGFLHEEVVKKIERMETEKENIQTLLNFIK